MVCNCSALKRGRQNSFHHGHRAVSAEQRNERQPEHEILTATPSVRACHLRHERGLLLVREAWRRTNRASPKNACVFWLQYWVYLRHRKQRASSSCCPASQPRNRPVKHIQWIGLQFLCRFIVFWIHHGTLSALVSVLEAFLVPQVFEGGAVTHMEWGLRVLEIRTGVQRVSSRAGFSAVLAVTQINMIIFADTGLGFSSSSRTGLTLLIVSTACARFVASWASPWDVSPQRSLCSAW